MKILVAMRLPCRLAPLAAGESDAARIERLLAAALLDDYVRPGFVRIRLESPHGPD